MYINILTFLILRLAFVSQSGTQSGGMPEGWIAAQAPTGPTAKNNNTSCAKHSHYQWRIEVQSDQVRILDSLKEHPTKAVFLSNFVPTKDMVGRATVFKVGDGLLLGYDAGEAGGGLWWRSADGSTLKRLSSEPVQTIVRRGKEILVITGLAHLSLDAGTIYSYSSADDASPLARITDLGSTPGAAALQEDGSLLIVTHRRILRLSTDNRLHELYQYENIGSYYPRSIAVDPKGNIFVGMRFYVLQLKPRSEGPYDAAWFMLAACRKTKIKELDCICVGDPKDK